MKTFYGLPVVINDLCDISRMQVGADFERLQSPELVKETNDWMRDFFGIERRVLQVTDPITRRRSIVMSKWSYMAIMKKRNDVLPLMVP